MRLFVYFFLREHPLLLILLQSRNKRRSFITQGKETNKQDFVLNRFPSIQGFFEVVLRDLYRIFGIFGSFSGSLKCKSLRWDIPFREVGAIISSSMYVRKPTSAGIPNTAAKKKKIGPVVVAAALAVT